MGNDFMGRKVRDKVTGFEGVVTGRVEYLTGCAQLLVQPQVKADGSYADPHWFDETRATFLPGTDRVVIDQGDNKPGADIEAPRK